jgi:steroid 5-alpha reductase family enzyme
MCWQGTHKTDEQMEKKKLSLSEADDTTSKFTPRKKKNIVTFLLLQFFPTSEILTAFF